jgi:toxin ParE1/3/4
MTLPAPKERWRSWPAFRDYCLGFSTLPKRGTVRDDIMNGVRIAGQRRSVSIAFSVTSHAALILGIFYGGRKIAPDVLDDRD